MIKVLVLFGNPVDKNRFDQHFDRIHLRLLTRIPNLEALQIDHVDGAVIGDSLLHRVVELRFASEEAMQEGLNSERGQEMARDFGRFASGGVTVLLCRSHSEPIDTGADSEESQMNNSGGK